MTIDTVLHVMNASPIQTDRRLREGLGRTSSSIPAGLRGTACRDEPDRDQRVDEAATKGPTGRCR